MDANFSIFIAFAAGFLSFVSPCVLPMIPSYMVFITGLSFDELEAGQPGVRRASTLHSLAFVMGFSLVFIALGASATALGSVVYQYQDLMMRLGGVVIIFFGLYVAGMFQFGAMNQEKRVHLTRKPQGFLGTVLVGITFGLGWTPCIGPILGSILVMASTADSVSTGVYLLSGYALGLGIPFLLAGIAFPQFLARMRGISRHMNTVTKISGFALVALGLLMVSGIFWTFTGYINRVVPAIDLERYFLL